VTFKEWSYECETCRTRQKHLHWDYDPIPTCACGGELHPYSLTLSRNRGVIDDQLDGGPRRFETMGADAPFIESKSQWRREVEKRGLIPYSKHDSAYYAKQRKLHDERLRDTGDPYPETERKPAVAPRYVRGRV
jgi:hypothetical protein